MKKNKLIWIIFSSLLVVGLSLAGILYFKPLPSTIFEKFLRLQADFHRVQDRDPQEFNFLVFGHLYGSPGEDDQMPAKSISKRLPELLELHPKFVVSLGDMVYHKSRPEFINLQAHFLSQLKVPFFNTPGNHDVSNSDELYQEFIGRQHYPAQTMGSSTMIFLDTERLSCKLDEEQQRTLQAELDAALADPQTKVIFVFMHKTLPFQDVKMRAMDNRVDMPNEWKCQKKDGSNPIMEKYFIPTAKKKPIILFAGDVGAWGNLSPYFQRDPWLPITLVMTGLGDTAQDNVIHVRVTPDSVQINALFLDTMQEVPIQKFNRDFWVKKATEN